MLLCFYLFLSSLLFLHVQTEVNDVQNLENDNFAVPGVLHDVSKREANRRRRKMKMEQKMKRRKFKKRKTSRQSVVLEGEHCQYIDFATARSSGSGCVDGTKMVVKNKAGNRKQFLIADSRTIYGFVEKGGKKFATDCSSYTDKTCDIQCKAVTGLSSISLSRSAKKKIPAGARVYSGSNCEWIDLNKVNSDGIGCANGYKFVIKPQSGNRRQMLFVDGKTILAFVTRGSKFADCSSFTEVTSQVDCKAVANLDSVSLPSACSGGSTSTACKCGVERTRRIVGGTEVNPTNKYPWMVTLVVRFGFIRPESCGGTLVASKYVISAAHCMFDLDGPLTNTDFQIRIGEHDLTTTGEGSLTEMTIDVTSYTNHEDFDYSTFDNDIAIIELAEGVDLTIYTPACLAKTSDTNTFDGKNAWVYGWGATSSGGPLSDLLLEVEVPVVTNAQCETTLSGITDAMICAGGVAGKDSCQGDSGGPLTYKSGDQHVLIGDVSWGEGCGDEGKYGVYGRISFFREWIEGKMSSPKYCGSGPDADE